MKQDTAATDHHRVPRAWLLAPLALLAALLATEMTGIDHAVSRWFYDTGTQTFPLRQNFLFDTILHHWTKYAVILSKATDAKFKLTAGDDALPGEYTVKVIGHPATGGDATNQFKLTVAPRDTFTLSMPFWTTALKQGESKSVTIAIARDKQFDQDVTIKFEGLSKGMSVEPTTAVIKNGEKEAKFILKAADDAALGDFAIKVTGHPTKGADATHDFKFAVAKK